jgi:tetratricopeptide (TPR) repeat protein
MARSAQRRTRQTRERRPTPRPPKTSSRPAPSYEDEMFFPRLRRQAKWMFVFLALVFGVGFVFFGVGGNFAGTGITDIFAGWGQDSGTASESDAREKIEESPSDPDGYLELATALQQKGEIDEAIAPLARYVELRPRDRNGLNQLAGLYLSQARRSQDEAARLQFEAGQLTGAGFTPDQSSGFGQEFGQGEIVKNLAGELNERLSQEYVKAQQAYKSASDTYGKLIAATPDREEAEQPSIFLQHAFAAQSANELQTAILAYRRYLDLAPDSPQEAGVEAQIKQLEAALKAQSQQR